jgi:hypothetical protein
MDDLRAELRTCGTTVPGSGGDCDGAGCKVDKLRRDPEADERRREADWLLGVSTGASPEGLRPPLLAADRPTVILTEALPSSHLKVIYFCFVVYQPIG